MTNVNPTAEDFNFNPESACKCDHDLALGCPANPGRVYGNDGTVGLCESGEGSPWSPDGPRLVGPSNTDKTHTDPVDADPTGELLAAVWTLSDPEAFLDVPGYRGAEALVRSRIGGRALASCGYSYRIDGDGPTWTDYDGQALAHALDVCAAWSDDA